MATGFKVADAYVEVHVDDDTRRGREKIKRETEAWSKGLGLNIGRNLLRGITSGLFGIFKALGMLTLLTAKMSLLAVAIGAVGAAVAGLLGGLVNLMPWISQLVTTAVAAAGALLLIPGAIAVVISAVAALKIGLQGVGAALKAGLTGDLEAFNKALEKLAPNAAEFVREVIKIKPAFDRVRISIQNSLFADLAELLRKMSEVYLPILEAGLSKVATSINVVFKSVGGFLLGGGTQADIAAIFSNASVAVANLAQGLVPVLTILRDVAVVASKVVADLSGKLLPILQGWADTIEKMRADGSLEKLITDGLGALKQFVGLAGDLLGILTGIFKAAGGAEGGGLFGFFDRLNTLVNSASGQNALVEIFTALGDAATALAPVLVILLQALVPILQGLSQIAIAFAPGLAVLAQALGEALASLAPAFIALAPLLDVIAEGLKPLAQILVDLVVNIAPYATEFFRLLADLLAELAPAAAPLGQAIGLLVLVFADLIAILGPLVADGLKLLAEVLIAILEPLEPVVRQMLPMFVVLFHSLFDALQPIIPALVNFGTTLAQLFIDHLPDLILLFEQWVPILTTIATLIAGELVQSLDDLTPMLPQLFELGLRIADAFLKITIALMPLIPYIIQLLGNTGQLTFYLEVLVAWLTIVAKSMELTAQVIQFWIEWGRRMWLGVLLIIEGIKGLVEWFQRAWSAVSSSAQSIRDAVVNTLSGLGSALYNAGRNAIQGFIDGVKSMFGPVGNAVSGVVQHVKDFFNWSPAKTGPLSGRGDMMFAGQNLVKRLVVGVQQEMDTAAGAAGTLAGLFGLGGQGAFAFAGASGAAQAQPQPIYALVQIGDRPVREMVQAEIIGNPGVVAAATDEGHRQNAGNTGRKRIGDT